MAIPSALGKVLEATGYLDGGQPAPGVLIAESAQLERRGTRFTPDALWRGPTSLTVYFKYIASAPTDDDLSAWRQEIWNEGFAPLLWVISPTKIELYNGFGRPLAQGDADANRLHTFKVIDSELAALDQLAGRFAMESGQFWLRHEDIDRKNTVDQRLLSDLGALERDLEADGLERGTAQGLIGRAIFTQYLVDRGIVDERKLMRHCGKESLSDALRNASSSQSLFLWLRSTFNGDMFPASMPMHRIRQKHFARVADFLEAVDPETGQHSLFPYRFDIIPVELISSIYEQFAHSHTSPQSLKTDGSARKLGVHYTRLSVASLVLDEVMNGVTGNETVMDLTCGSGIFLVEAFRRLVMIKCKGKPNRRIIRATLYNQVFGVDISEAAVRVATFSLYLAALELDPDPHPAEALKFKPLIGKTLFVGNARDVETTPEGAGLITRGERRRFDLIVGNPPWTFKGKKGTAQRTKISGGKSGSRGEGFDFVIRAIDFAHETTRYGIILSAMPFFAGSKTGAAAALDIIRRLSPATIVNLAPLIRWLFPTAKMPAVALLARCRPQPDGQLTVVNIPWSPSGERSQTFEIAPSDISSLSLAAWEKHPERLKTAAFGCFRDIALLDEVQADRLTLGNWLESIGTRWRDGLILGNESNRTRSASDMRGLPFLNNKDLQYFKVPDGLPTFREAKTEWPRSKETFTGPLLLVKEFLNSSPRPIAALYQNDLVYTDAYFGASIGRRHVDAGRILSIILSSSFAAWFFLMTASEFGVWKRRLLTKDVGILPVPEMATLVSSPTGTQMLALEKRFRTKEITVADWHQLDVLTSDAYGLDAADRIVVQDGLLRAEWQWDEGRQHAAGPATVDGDLRPYADAFLGAMNAWLSVAKKRSMKAEIFDLPTLAPLRVIRFLLREGPQSPEVEIIEPQGDLASVLRAIGSKLNVPIAKSLVGQRELRVYSQNEVVLIKPAARRYWMKITALEDADAIVAESFTGATT